MADLSSINAAGNQQIGNAANNGRSAINSFDPTSIAANNANQQGSLYGANGSQTGQMNDYMNMYKQSILNNPTATDLYSTANDKFNIPQLQETSNALNNAVLTAPQTNLDNAKGFNYDSNQVAAKNNLDLGRLTPLAIAAQNNANTAQSNASNYVTAGLSQNATNLLPTQAYGTLLGSELGYQATGLNQNQHDTLNALVSKMQAGEQLSASEMAAYEALSQAEENAQASEDVANIQNQGQLANTIQQQKYLSIPAGSNLVNTYMNGILNPATGAVRKY